MGDNKWAIISALATVAALVVALIPFLVGRDTKQLSVETITTAKVVDLSDPALSSLKLTYKDVEVSKLSSATIEIRNSGTRPIERTDFELPLVLRLPNTGDVFSATLSRQTPEYLAPVITSDGTTVSIAPLLLNPDDNFRLSIAIRGEINEPRVEARISGTTISRTTYPSDDNKWYLIAVIISAIAMTYLYFYMAFAVAPMIVSPEKTVLLPRTEGIFTLLTLLLGILTLCATAIQMFDLTRTQRIVSGIVFGCLGPISAFLVRLRYRRLRFLHTSHS
jgi:hypothetical protein